MFIAPGQEPLPVPCAPWPGLARRALHRGLKTAVPLLQNPLFPRQLAVHLNVPRQLAPQVCLRLGRAEQVHGVHVFSDARLCVTTRF